MQQYIIKRSDGKYFCGPGWFNSFFDNINYAVIYDHNSNLKKILGILKETDKSYEYKLCKVKVTIEEKEN